MLISMYLLKVIDEYLPIYLHHMPCMCVTLLPQQLQSNEEGKRVVHYVVRQEDFIEIVG